MAILIEGMEMPKTCNDCPLHELFFAFGKQNIVCSPTGHALGGIDAKHLKESRNAGYCPLIEVPAPHGRLIDASVAYDKIAEQEGGNYVDMDAVGMGLDETPTVIPESEETE